MNSLAGFALLVSGIAGLFTGLGIATPKWRGVEPYTSLAASLLGLLIGSVLIAISVIFIVAGVTS